MRYRPLHFTSFPLIPTTSVDDDDDDDYNDCDEVNFPLAERRRKNYLPISYLKNFFSASSLTTQTY